LNEKAKKVDPKILKQKVRGKRRVLISEKGVHKGRVNPGGREKKTERQGGKPRGNAKSGSLMAPQRKQGKKESALLAVEKKCSRRGLLKHTETKEPMEVP